MGSLVDDILRHVPVKQHRKKCDRIGPRELHLVRIPGLHYRNGKWEAVVFYKNVTLTIGCFKSPKRALMARALWTYWREKGFEPHEIPKGPKREPYSRSK
nr:MAG TPA: hypothetical protein [Caudoviricetes sp.]